MSYSLKKVEGMPCVPMPFGYLKQFLPPLLIVVVINL
jgi:hypothetical protein